MVWTPLKNISQLGSLFPIYGKINLMFQTTNQLFNQQRCPTRVGFNKTSGWLKFLVILDSFDRFGCPTVAWHSMGRPFRRTQIHGGRGAKCHGAGWFKYIQIQDLQVIPFFDLIIYIHLSISQVFWVRKIVGKGSKRALPSQSLHYELVVQTHIQL